MTDPSEKEGRARSNTAANGPQGQGTAIGGQTFDVVIIGGGPGGYSTALRAAELGKSVALVEEDARPGGTCLNEGCVPSKAMLQAARQMRGVGQAARMGIDMRVQAVDLSRLLGFKNTVVATQVTGLEGLLTARKVTLIQAFGQAHPDLSVTLTPSHEARKGKQGTMGPINEENDPFPSPQAAQIVEKETIIHGRDIVLATGSRPRALPGADFSEHAVLDSRAALSLLQIPQSVIIIGSGAIGTEFATLWNGLGARVTLLEAQPRILPAYSRRISALETRQMRRAGVTVLTGVKIQSVKEGANQLATVHYADSTPTRPSLKPKGAITPSDLGNPNSKSASATSKKGQATDKVPSPQKGVDGGLHKISAQFVLVSIGRVPNTDEKWVEDLGVKKDEQGLVETDAFGRTNVPHVWALGDITPGKQLAHRAFAQGLVVAESIAGVPTEPVDNRDVPMVSFALAQVAQVGWDREAAVKSGRFTDVAERSVPTGGNARVVMNGQQGVVTIVSGYRQQDGRKTGERIVLGVQMIGPLASELAGEAEELVGNSIPLREAARLIHPHPTFSEALGEALLSADGRPLHTR